MTRKVIEDVSLAIWRGPKLEIVFHTSHGHFFFYLYKDVKLAIKGMKKSMQFLLLSMGIIAWY